MQCITVEPEMCPVSSFTRGIATVVKKSSTSGALSLISRKMKIHLNSVRFFWSALDTRKTEDFSRTKFLALFINMFKNQHVNTLLYLRDVHNAFCQVCWRPFNNFFNFLFGFCIEFKVDVVSAFSCGKKTILLFLFQRTVRLKTTTFSSWIKWHALANKG